MAEYIEKNAAIAKLTRLEVTEPLSTMIDAKRMLADMPAADVAPVRRGQWKPAGFAFMGESADCSECGYRIATRLSRDWNYCPRCSAKMEVEHDERGRD